jgi:hypothetical protein
VSSGDILAEVETDKATMDMESYEDGTILYIGVAKALPLELDMWVRGRPSFLPTGLSLGRLSRMPCVPQYQTVSLGPLWSTLMGLGP